MLSFSIHLNPGKTIISDIRVIIFEVPSRAGDKAEGQKWVPPEGAWKPAALPLEEVRVASLAKRITTFPGFPSPSLLRLANGAALYPAFPWPRSPPGPHGRRGPDAPGRERPCPLHTLGFPAHSAGAALIPWPRYPAAPRNPLCGCNALFSCTRLKYRWKLLARLEMSPVI